MKHCSQEEMAACKYEHLTTSQYHYQLTDIDENIDSEDNVYGPFTDT